MNILFLTMTDIPDIECRYIYTELIKVFIDKGHKVSIVSPDYREDSEPFKLLTYTNHKLLKVRVLGGARKSIFKKAINTVMLDRLYLYAIKKFLKDEKFDLILYSTPPITLGNVIEYIKKRDNSKTYLMLKDIFPQNAVDLNMLETHGVKSLIYNYFRNKEKKLYNISDFIGCMSEANVDYILKHNYEIIQNKVGLCVNSVIPITPSKIDKLKLREKHNIPEDKVVFFYGGNFGLPQGIEFLVKVLKDNTNYKDRYFVLCGNGSELGKVKEFMRKERPDNIMLIEGLPKEEYDSLLSACDVGLLFLDNRFTIPNFPSRMLPYMEYSIPILAATDTSTDVGDKILEGDFGWWCESNSINEFTRIVDSICKNPSISVSKGLNARRYLETNYTAEISYRQIMQVL